VSDFLCRGEGTGDGVIRAVLETAVHRMLSDERYWRCGLDEGYYSFAPRQETSQQRRIQIKAYATLIMMSIFHGITPDPVSPFLLANVLQDTAIVEDRAFIAAVAPATFESLSEWPIDASPVPASPKNLALLCNLDTEVCSVVCSLKGC
jgi:hypothetical protein